MNKRAVRVGLAVAAIVAAALAASVQVCHLTSTMPPRELFEMGPVASMMGSLSCIVTALLL